MSETNGWNQYEKLVLSEIRDLKEEVAGMHDQLTLVRIDIAMLKIKSGLWGAGAATIVALAAYTASSAGVI